MSDGSSAQNVAQFGSFRSRAATHAGTAGRNNEDAYLNRPDLGLWVVADGAGGHHAGEVASAAVVDVLQGIESGLSAADMLQEVRARLESVHEHLRAAASDLGANVIMATTAVVVLARDDYFACLWVGDSPAYLLRGNTLTKITRDHSLVQDLTDRGIITEEEATDHPQANVITRAVGADSDALNLDKRTGRLVLGDRLLLCSDGLSKTLSNEQLAELLSGGGDGSAERLVNAALEAQAIDNVTAVTIDFVSGDASTTLEAGGSSVTEPASAEASAEASADEHGGTAHDDGAAVGT
jgi:serine/threonine-protein phosphatase Stp1